MENLIVESKSSLTPSPQDDVAPLCKVRGRVSQLADEGVSQKTGIVEIQHSKVWTT